MRPRSASSSRGSPPRSPAPSSPLTVPNVLHFCYGLRPGDPFGLLEYLAIKSATDHNRPEAAYLYHHHPLSGPWWERASELVRPVRLAEVPTSVFDRPLTHYAHQADLVRLLVLYERGGIYLDLDTLTLRPMTDLLGHACVMGRQGDRGLCNAVILSAPRSAFLRAWLVSYRLFRGGESYGRWDEHSVVVPGLLARREHLPVEVLDERAFFYPLWTDMDQLFVSDDPSPFEGAYCVHYWASVTREPWLSKVSLESIARGTSNFDRWARRHLGG